VTVIAVIPTLNEEELLLATIASLRRQNMDCVVVVVDGGSTDGTLTIAERNADIVASTRRGVGLARNLGASVGEEGDILVFTDADTILPDGALGRVVRAFTDGVAAVTLPAEPSNRTWLNVLIWAVLNSLSALSVWAGLPMVPGYFIAVRWSAWSKTLYSVETKSEDIDFSLRLRRHGRVVRLPWPRVVTSSRRVDKRGIRSVSDYINLLIRGTIGLPVSYPPVRAHL